MYIVQQHIEWKRSAADLAKTAKTTVNTVYRYVKEHRETESWTERQNLNQECEHSKLKCAVRIIELLIQKEAPFISLRTIQKKLKHQYDLEIPANKVRWILRKWCGLSYRQARYCA